MDIVSIYKLVVGLNTFPWEAHLDWTLTFIT